MLLTAVLILGITTANTALSSTERPAVEQQAAVGLSEQLTAESAPVTERTNVLTAGALANLTIDELRATYGAAPGHGIRISLDGETIVEAGDPTGGTTIDRLVLIEKRVEQSLEPSFDESRSVTLPRRTESATVRIDPTADAVVRTVRANDRVLLRNESGLTGEFDVSLSRFETKQLFFESTGLLTKGDVSVQFAPPETRKATLRVTLDA